MLNAAQVKSMAVSVGTWLNAINEKVVGLLVLLLILDVWLGVIDRYIMHWQISWTEELARYIMIWAILLAIPCCCFRREHISLTLLRDYFPAGLQRCVNILLDLIAVGLFVLLAITGTTFAEKGLVQYSTVFSMPMAVPYAAIPVAFSLAALQSAITLIRDYSTVYVNDDQLGGTDI